MQLYTESELLISQQNVLFRALLNAVCRHRADWYIPKEIKTFQGSTEIAIADEDVQVPDCTERKSTIELQG